MKYKFFKLDELGNPHKMACETQDGKVARTCPMLTTHIGDDIRHVLVAAQYLGYSAYVADDSVQGDRQLPNLVDLRQQREVEYA